MQNPSKTTNQKVMISPSRIAKLVPFSMHYSFLSWKTLINNKVGYILSILLFTIKKEQIKTRNRYSTAWQLAHVQIVQTAEIDSTMVSIQRVGSVKYPHCAGSFFCKEQWMGLPTCLYCGLCLC